MAVFSRVEVKVIGGIAGVVQRYKRKVIETHQVLRVQRQVKVQVLADDLFRFFIRMLPHAHLDRVARQHIEKQEYCRDHPEQNEEPVQNSLKDKFEQKG